MNHDCLTNSVYGILRGEDEQGKDFIIMMESLGILERNKNNSNCEGALKSSSEEIGETERKMK